MSADPDAAVPGCGMRLSRRAAIRGAIAAAATGGLAGALRAQTAAVGTGLIAEGLTLLTGVGGNVVVRSAGGEQLLVDTGARESSDTLLSTLASLPGAGRVSIVFNTHWHTDQTGGNAALGRGGARIVAHEKTRLHLATDYYLPAEDRYEQALPAEAWPTTSFFADGSTTFGGERIDYGYLLQAHTDGDIYVWFRDSNVMAVGDALSPSRDPVLDWFGGGWLGGRADALAMLLAISDARTRFVPSFGPVVGRDYLEAEHALMVRLFDRVQERVRSGMSARDMLEAGVMDDLPRRFEDPLRFLHDAYKGMWAHHNTLSHDIV